MGQISLAVRTTTFTIAHPSLEIIAAANDSPLLKQMDIVQVTATAQSLGLGRPAASGVAPTTPVTMLREDRSDATAQTTVALAWTTTDPTVPAAFFRRWNSAATAGVGCIWTFPRGLKIDLATTLVLWNITTAVACDVNIMLEE